DVYIPIEVAKRAAGKIEGIVGPPIPFGLAHDHRGAHGVVHLRLETFVALLRDVVTSLADAGFTRIVLLNGHYVNSWAMSYAVAQFYDALPEGVRVFPFPYWQALPPERAAEYLSGTAGLHANVGETSAVLAIDPALCDMERVRDFTPDLGELRTSPFALLDPLFQSTPGSFWTLLEDGGGGWGLLDGAVGGHGRGAAARAGRRARARRGCLDGRHDRPAVCGAASGARALARPALSVVAGRSVHGLADPELAVVRAGGGKA